jgi:Pyruvate/2-oxoacid:ferredoxin oxidoreductase delta subunit
MATFLARAIGLSSEPDNPFTDISGHTHEWNIHRVAAAGISIVCNSAGDLFCPEEQITRAQIATFLSCAFQLALDPDFNHNFGDVDDDDVHSAAIATLAQHGISEGCAEGLNYCPDEIVTREQMAAFLHRSVEISNELFGTYAPVTLYDDRGWVGVSYPAEVGTHTAADLAAASMNDAASSIRVAEGYEATICWNDRGTGTCAVLTASVADLNIYGLENRVSWIEVRLLP